MAQRAAQPRFVTFSEWLQSVCEAKKISKRKLYIYFVRAGGEAHPKTVDRWLDGVNDPPTDDMRIMVRALANAPETRGMDVYASFRKWMEAFRGGPERSRAHLHSV